jgi:hypothetical protein
MVTHTVPRLLFLSMTALIFYFGMHHTLYADHITVAGGKIDTASFWRGLVGVIVLAVIDGFNFFSMKKFGNRGTAILAGKIVTRTHFLGTISPSALT